MTKQSVAEAIFNRRARSIYNGMKKRADKEGSTPLMPSFGAFKNWLVDRFCGKPEGHTICDYSGQMLIAENFCVDHRFPISRSGSFAISNLAICSEKENLRKGNMTAQEYGAFKHFLTCNLPPDVQVSIWRRLEVGDVQRFSYFRRKRKA